MISLLFPTLFVGILGAPGQTSDSSRFHDASEGIIKLSLAFGVPWNLGQDWKPTIIRQLVNVSVAMQQNSSQEELSTYLGYASSLMNQWRLASLK